MELLLNLLIFSLPLGVLSRITIFPNVSVYLNDLITVLIFLLLLHKLLVKKSNIHNMQLFKAFALFISIAFISLFVNASKLNFVSFLISLSYLLRFIAYSSLIFAFQFTGTNFKKSIPKKLLVSGLIFTIFGFVQYFWYSNLKNLYYAGWDEHLYRLFGTLLDPNFAGVYIVLFFILVFSYLFYSKEKLIYGTLCVFVLLAIYLTYSRSALISLIVGTFTFLVLNRKTKIVIPVLIFFVSLILVFSNFKIEGLNPLRIASVDARIISAKEAILIIEKNPILGVGFNAYRYAQIRYNLRDSVKTRISNADASTDNSFLFILATTGAIGFIAYLNILRIIINQASKKTGDQDQVLRSAFLPLLASWFLSALFINTLFYIPILAWMFTVVGVMVNRRQ